MHKALKEADKLKEEANALYQDGHRFKAYKLYTQACKILLEATMDGTVAHTATLDALRKAYSIIKGNQAALCMNISHGSTVQAVEEALWFHRNEAGAGFVVAPLLAAMTTQKSDTVNWDWLTRLTRRRTTALEYFGSFSTIDADEMLRNRVLPSVAGTSLATSADEQRWMLSFNMLYTYRVSTPTVPCPHVTPSKSAGYFHFHATVRQLVLEGSKLPKWKGAFLHRKRQSQTFYWLLSGNGFLPKECPDKGRQYPLSVEITLTSVNKANVSLASSRWDKDYITSRVISNQEHNIEKASKVYGSACHAASCLLNDEIMSFGGYWPESDSPPKSRGVGMYTYRHFIGRPMLETSCDPKHAFVKRPPSTCFHTIVYNEAYAKFYMFGGMVLVPKERDFATDALWEYDDEAEAWKEIKFRRDSGPYYSPMARCGHVSWSHGPYIWVFGGKSFACDHDLSRGNTPQGKNCLFFNDLWCFDIRAKNWHLVKASGIHPAPRADMGLAVSKRGRRIFLIGGRAGLCARVPENELYGKGDDLSAEVYELDLGDSPLRGGIPLNMGYTMGSAHWRQVTPTKKGATWFSARAHPSCHFLTTKDAKGSKDEILIVGGEVYNEDLKNLQVDNNLLVLSLTSAESSPELQEKYQKDLDKRLKEKSNAGMSDSDSEEDEEDVPRAIFDGRFPDLLDVSFASFQKTAKADFLSLKRIPGGAEGMWCTRLGPETQLLILPKLFDINKYGRPLMADSFISFGPDAITLPFEPAPYLGCSWLGVCQYETGNFDSFEEPYFKYTQVVRVFGTKKAAQEYFSNTLGKHDIGTGDNRLTDVEMIRRMKANLEVYGSSDIIVLGNQCDEFSRRGRRVVTSTGEEFAQCCIIFVVGHVWCKMVILNPDEETDILANGVQIVLDRVQEIVDEGQIKAEEGFITQCCRCGIQSPLANASREIHGRKSHPALKICNGCKRVRFCNQCGKSAYHEHAELCSYQQFPVFRISPTVIPDLGRIDEELLREPLKELIHPLTRAKCDLRLRDKQLVGIINPGGPAKLERFAEAMGFVAPWGLAVHLVFDGAKGARRLHSLSDLFLNISKETTLDDIEWLLYRIHGYKIHVHSLAEPRFEVDRPLYDRFQSSLVYLTYFYCGACSH